MSHCHRRVTVLIWPLRPDEHLVVVVHDEMGQPPVVEVVVVGNKDA
jgi:xanthine/CO dehydrogenase XdhC/CoxF family maturation factor